MTGARSFRKERERQRRTAAKTARAVSGASYMVRMSERPHVVPAGDFLCMNCGVVVTPATEQQSCLGRPPSRSETTK